jgi:hypothetical protein
MERVYVQLGTVGGSLSEGLEGWSKWVEQSGVNKTVPVTFSQALRELTVNMQTSNDITQSYIDSIKSSKWVSSILDNAINRHVGVVERILQKNVQMKASCLIAVNRIDPKAS